MDRARARSLTRTVQLTAVVLLAGGAAAAFVPLGDPTADVPMVETAAPPPPKPPAPRVEIEPTLLSAAINEVAGPVKNQATEIAAAPDASPTPPPPTGVESWRYLGAISGGAFKRAILVINDQQVMLKVGQTHGNAEVIEIDRAFVKIKDGETEHTLGMAPRQRPALTVVDPVSRSTQPSSVVNGVNRTASSAYNPSTVDSRRLREQERAKLEMKAKMEGRSGEIEAFGADGPGKESGEKGVK